MDILFPSAEAFAALLNTEYEIVLARKGITVTLRVVFHKNHFYHLAGLHYLKDLQKIKGNREKLFDRIISKEISDRDIEKSVFYNTISQRLLLLQNLEKFFDSNSLVFKYDRTSKSFSAIEADYLMENIEEDRKVFTFLSKNPDGNYFCRSFFPMDKQDFSFGQSKWTILLKVKENKLTDKRVVLFRHPNYNP